MVDIVSFLQRDTGRGDVFTAFQIHCMLPDIHRWERTYAGHCITILGELGGWYIANASLSHNPRLRPGRIPNLSLPVRQVPVQAHPVSIDLSC
jgi:hypothetical protein